MLNIRIKIIVLVFLLTLAAIYVLAKFSDRKVSILPSQHSESPWRGVTSTDGEFGGTSSIVVKDSSYNISLDFTVEPKIQYPFVAFSLIFSDDANPNRLEDWSAYSSIMLRVKCSPKNIFHLSLLTYDDQVTKDLTDINSFRPTLAFFSCNEDWQSVRLGLDRLDTPEWWLERNKLDLDNRTYSLSKVKAAVIATSMQSPVNIPSNIMIDEIVLEGKNLPLIYALSALILMMWSAALAYGIYQFYRVTGKSNVIHGVVPVAYQSLSIEPRHEREKEAVLDYMASAYSNPNLSVQMAVNDLGFNRVKINDILRMETGLTFSLYLNKLRLTEAARLLSEKNLGVAETAFAVGYNSLSYFNRVFKKEYGCNPSAFKCPDDSSQCLPRS